MVVPIGIVTGTVTEETGMAVTGIMIAGTITIIITRITTADGGLSITAHVTKFPLSS